MHFTLRDYGYGASSLRGVLFNVLAFTGTHCACPRRDGQAELTWAAGYMQWRFQGYDWMHLKRGKKFARKCTVFAKKI